MKTSKTKCRTSERGSFLIPVLVLTLILGGLSVTLLHETLAERQAVHHHETSMLALEIAESGLVRAEMEIRALSDVDGDGIGTVSGTYAGGRYDVSAVQDASYPDRWVMRARGEHGLSVRLIEVGIRRRESGFWIEGLFSDDALSLNGTIATDSYDSRLGTWDSQAIHVDPGGRYGGGRGHVGSNEGITVIGTSVFVRGNAIPGPLDVVTQSGGPTVQGDMMPRAHEIPLERVSYDEFRGAMLNNNNAQLLSTSPSSSTSATGTGTDGVAPGQDKKVSNSYDEKTMSISAQADTQVILEGGTYFFTDLTLSAQAQLVIRGPCKIYVTGDVDLTGGGIVNLTGRPTDCQIFAHPYALPAGFSPSKTGIKITGGAQVGAALYAPEMAVAISGNGDLFGAVVGKTITVVGTAAFHYDESLRMVDGGTVVILERLYWRELSVPRR